jgi:hypothetical protein
MVDRCFPLERADYGTSRNDVKPSRTAVSRLVRNVPVLNSLEMSPVLNLHGGGRVRPPPPP